MGGETLVGGEGIVHGIMCQVQVEGASFVDRLVHLGQSLECQGLGEEGIASVIFLQPGDGPFLLSLDVPIALLAEIAARMADGRSGDVHVETEVLREFTLAALPSEMRLADVDGLVALLFQEPWQDPVVLAQAVPVPVVGTILVPVV